MNLVFKVDSIFPLTVETEKVILDGGSYGYAFLNLPLGHGLSKDNEIILSVPSVPAASQRLSDTDFLNPPARTIRPDLIADPDDE
jgi:hypothetical protein